MKTLHSLIKHHTLPTLQVYKQYITSCIYEGIYAGTRVCLLNTLEQEIFSKHMVRLHNNYNTQLK